MNDRPRVSLIATVLDERPSLDAWLAGIDRQTCAPDEVIIVDGGSTDGTWERLEDWRPPLAVTLVRVPAASISHGRNVAIERARGDIVVVTDAGTIAEPEWIALLVAAFGDPDVDVASGFFTPVAERWWDRALAAATLPDVDEIDGARFQPSSRSVAFRRSWYLAGVRYPEWLDYCEDLVWDLALRRAGARFRFVQDARVQFRVRPTPAAFARQYYRYARGDGKAGLFARRHLIRYGAYLLGAIVVARQRPHELALAGAAGGLYVRQPLTRLWRRGRAAGRPVLETLSTAPLVLVVRASGDLAKMAGYPAGLVWRQRRFGTLGWRSSWRRVDPNGTLNRPGGCATRSPAPASSPDA